MTGCVFDCKGLDYLEKTITKHVNVAVMLLYSVSAWF
jgi:hypothetical protein